MQTYVFFKLTYLPIQGARPTQSRGVTEWGCMNVREGVKKLQIMKLM